MPKIRKKKPKPKPKSGYPAGSVQKRGRPKGSVNTPRILSSKSKRVGRPPNPPKPPEDTPPCIDDDTVDIIPFKIESEGLDIDLAPDKYLIQPPTKGKELTPRQMRMIEYYSMGFSVMESAVACGFQAEVTPVTYKQLYVDLIHSAEGKKYYRRLQEEYRERNYATKDRITRELVSRIPGSSTKDLVALTGILNKMFGYNQEVEIQVNNTQINIEWGEDPWVLARDSVDAIDVPSEEEDTGEEETQ